MKRPLWEDSGQKKGTFNYLERESHSKDSGIDLAMG